MKRKYIICSIILLSALIVGIAFGMRYLKYKREEARRISCASILRSMGLAFQQYAMDFENHFPDKDGADGFELLRTYDYLTDYNIFLCPSTKTRRPRRYKGRLKEEIIDYVYNGGLLSSDKNQPLIWDKPGNHQGYGNVLFLNGTVKFYKGENWNKMIKYLQESKEK